MVEVVRPRLRRDTAFLQTATGTYVRNGDGALLLKGKSSYRLLSIVGRYLNGERTVEELCADLPSEQREAVTQLVSALLDNGLAKNVEPEATEELDEPLRTRFAAQIAFIDHFTDAPIRRFSAFRRSRVLLGGGGAALVAAGRGLLRNGLEHLAVVRAAPELANEGFDAEVEVVSEAAVDGYDVVAYCGIDGDLAIAYDLNRQCIRAGVPFLASVLIGQTAVLGPFARPGGACWCCALLRLGDNVDPAVVADVWRTLAVGVSARRRTPMSAAVSQMLGNAMAFEIFSRLAGGVPA